MDPMSAEAPQNKDILFDEGVSQGINKARQLMQTRFGPDSSNPLRFHTWENHLEVMLNRLDRAYAIIRKVRPELATSRNLGLAKLLVAWHDVVQDWSPKESGLGQPFLYTERGRYIGFNEQESGRQLRQFMYYFNQDHGDTFTQEEMGRVDPSMSATIPTFKSELGVIQERLTSDTPFEGKILALLDINGCLIDGPGQFIREGNREFQELKKGITQTVENAQERPEGLNSLTAEEKIYITEQLRAWLRFQIVFAKGRQDQLPQELHLLGDPELEQALAEGFFNKGEETIGAVSKRVVGLNRKTLNRLVQEVGLAA